MAALLLSLLLLSGMVPVSHAQGHEGTQLSPRPASMDLAASSLPLANPPTPNYDEQIGATFTQSFTTLSYNVTALAQTDAAGYGPAYILNGLTQVGYWYQTGVSYHWPSQNGGYQSGFSFSYEVFAPNGKSIYPNNAGAGLEPFSGPVNSGDTVLLSLSFFGTSVELSALDENTGASARQTYSSFGGSTFIGETQNVANDNGFFSGVMTEWYHVSEYMGNEQKVTYSSNVAITSAWLWIDEFIPGATGPPLFDNQTSGPITFSVSTQVYSFASNGATVYGSQNMFITGQLNSATSRVNLLPATVGTQPSFTASYTFLGRAQSSDLGGGTNEIVEADPGTNITVSVNSSDLSTSVIWAFSTASGSSITFAAGQNVTYVYYELVQEAVAYEVAVGAQIPTAATVGVTYEGAPAQASSSVAPITDVQAIGTSPVTILAVVGTNAELNGTIAGANGQRWSASGNGWTIYAPNSIPQPIPLYEQYEVTLNYSVVGGGVPPQAPVFNSTAFGAPVSIAVPSTPTPYWLDSGSLYNFTNIVNSTTTGERWADYGANGVGAPNRTFRGIGNITSAEALSEDYVHQYLADIYVNDARGGSANAKIDQSVLSSAGLGNPSFSASLNGGQWFAAGSAFNVTASALTGWRFESWQGSGSGSYNGTATSFQFNLNSPLFTDGATFYVSLSISAGSGASVAYSYGSMSGSVPAGSAETIYVPPSANVTLRATPSIIVYSFSSWEVAGVSNSTDPVMSLAVGSPTSVAATTSLDYPIISGIVVVVLFILVAAVLAIRGRRKRTNYGMFTPN